MPSFCFMLIPFLRPLSTENCRLFKYLDDRLIKNWLDRPTVFRGRSFEQPIGLNGQIIQVRTNWCALCDKTIYLVKGQSICGTESIVNGFLLFLLLPFFFCSTVTPTPWQLLSFCPFKTNLYCCLLSVNIRYVNQIHFFISETILSHQRTDRDTPAPLLDRQQSVVSIPPSSSALPKKKAMDWQPDKLNDLDGATLQQSVTRRKLMGALNFKYIPLLYLTTN